jgi:hypothetical protein
MHELCSQIIGIYRLWCVQWSPVQPVQHDLSGLEAGRHQLRVSPMGRQVGQASRRVKPEQLDWLAYFVRHISDVHICTGDQRLWPVEKAKKVKEKSYDDPQKLWVGKDDWM